MVPPNYDHNAIERLLQRTEYESFLLEEVCRQEIDRLVGPEPYESLLYPPLGGDVQCALGGYAFSLSTGGGWRHDESFLEAMAPLIFVTAFKLLDMVIEWILAENGHASTFRFQQKITALRGNLVFPRIIDSNPWLHDRLLMLYEQLEPLRGTIIHNREFKVVSGALHVKSTKHGSMGSEVIFSMGDLCNLALTFVSILRYLQGSWHIDDYQLKRIDWSLDELAHIHGLPLRGQRRPRYITIRVYAFEANPIAVDLNTIRCDTIRLMPESTPFPTTASDAVRY